MPQIIAWLGSAFLTFLSFVVVITAVVFFHELSHLLVGLWRGVKPEVFSIGMGPRLGGFKLGETDVRISLLPIGGYVKFAGDNPLIEPKPEDLGRGFYQATPVSRGLIAVAGPVANFVLAFFIFFALYLTPQQTLAPVVGFVKPGSPAAIAGILPRDQIVSVEGKPTPGFLDVQEVIQAHAGQPIELGLLRKGQRIDLRITPGSFEEKNPIETSQKGRIGISAVPRAAVLARLGDDTPASRAGLQTFDKISRFNGAPVVSYEDLVDQLAVAMSRNPAAAQAAGASPTAKQASPTAEQASPTAEQNNTNPNHSSFLLEGIRPRGVPAPGAVLWVQDPLKLSIELPALGRKVLPSEVENLLGLACADLNVFALAPGGGAEASGVQRGDRLLSIDGKPILWWSDELETERAAKGLQPMQLEVLRDGKKLALTLQQVEVDGIDETGMKAKIPELGMAPDERILAGAEERITVRYDIATAFVRAGEQTVRVVRVVALGIGALVTGKISSRAIGGPLQIADVARQAADNGIASLLAITAWISVNLGLMNLIPLPVLDGFHVFSAILEKIRRRPLSIRVIEIANMVGLAMLATLMVYALRNDLVRKFFQ